MNRYIIFVIIFLIPLLGTPQESKDHTVSLVYGKPWHPEIINVQENFNFSINYQNRFAVVFAFEIFVQYARINSFPEFSKNEKELNNFIIGQQVTEAIGNTWWDEMNTFSMGSKIHYSFVNNSKFFFSIYLGAGIYNSTSKSAELNSIQRGINGEVVSFEFTIPEDNYTGIFYMPGLHFNYNFYKSYIIGLDFNLHRNLDNDKTYQLPVIPSYYGANLSIGKKF